MTEENKEEPEVALTEEERALEDKINKMLSDVLHCDVESVGRFKLMAIPDKDSSKSTLCIVFLPRKTGMSQIALSVSFVDISGFILEVSKYFVQTKKTEVLKAKDRMMVA